MALPLAQGDYVLFLDSDDTYTPDAFAVLRAALDETQADVCYFGLRMTGDNDGAVFTDDLPLHTPLTLQETPALLLNRPSACIAAWRRTLFTDTGIRFRARGWGEDLCMTRKMLTAAQSVVILPDVLYLYRQHEGSVTKRALDANAEIMDAIDDVLTWYQARGLFEQYENELGKLCVDNVLSRCVRAHSQGAERAPTAAAAAGLYRRALPRLPAQPLSERLSGAQEAGAVPAREEAVPGGAPAVRRRRTLTL
ncbi:MAG: glycosyltransferase family 2 protein [Oscillospiraceae bacterium]